MKHLPNELLVEIAKFLPVKKVVTIHSLSKFLRSLKLSIYEKIRYNAFAFNTYSVKSVLFIHEYCSDLSKTELEEITYFPGLKLASLSVKLPDTLKILTIYGNNVRPIKLPEGLQFLRLTQMNCKGVEIPSSVEELLISQCKNVRINACNLRHLSWEHYREFVTHSSDYFPVINDNSLFRNLQHLKFQNISQSDLNAMENLTHLHLISQDESLDFSNALSLEELCYNGVVLRKLPPNLVKFTSTSEVTIENNKKLTSLISHNKCTIKSAHFPALEILLISSLNIELHAPNLKQLILIEVDENFTNFTKHLSKLSELQIIKIPAMETFDIRHLPLQDLLVFKNECENVLLPENCKITRKN